MSRAFIQAISVPFNPTRIAGCQLWLDGADAATVTGTSSVTAWTDKSGKGNNPTFSGTNPSYNSATKVITTANANQQFTVPAASIQQSTGSGSLFFVYGDQQTGGGNSSGYNALWGTAGPSERFYQTLQAPTNAYAINGPFSPSGTVSTALATTNTLLYNMNYTYNSSTGDLRINGTTLSSSYGGTPVPSGALTLSGTGWGVVANVRLYEVISYKGATLLTTPQIQQIEGYLAQKWGLTANLPPGHPGLTQTIYTSNYNAKNPGSAITPSPGMTNLPYSTLTPINLADTGTCKFWLDAADSTSFAFSSGSNISTWSDKSGNGYNATQYWTTPTVYNSANKYVQFTNSTSGMICSVPTGVFPTSLSVFIVYQKTGANNTYETLVNRVNDSTSNPSPWELRNDTVVLGDGSTNFTVKTSTWNINSGTSTTLLNFTLSASQFYEYINGSPTYSVTSAFLYGDTGSTKITLGTRISKDTQFTGNIYEVIIYNTALITTQRQSIEGYLAWKWGLQANLINTHPYYNGPPGRPSQVAGIPVQVKMSAIRVVQLQYSGTYTTSGNFFATFTGNGSVTVLSPVTINYFAIGGGGGGGAGPGGGGGAGGLQMGSMSLSPGTYNVVIGPGGAAHTNGSNTTFGTTLVVALGGGFGASGYPSTETAGSGGCGGGQGGGSSTRGTGSQGFNGAIGIGVGGTGGGGVGGIGTADIVNTGGAGGIGVLYYGTYYGGGGGGAPNHGAGTGFAGAGGLGGGGRGGQNGLPILDPVAGTPNTGGGGGGGRDADQYSGPGAAGGSGVFIISY